MEFRWIALLTLWTLMIGPIFDQPPRAHPRAPRSNTAVKLAPASAALR